MSHAERMDFYGRFVALLEKRGFKNVRDFARQADIPASSLYDFRDGKIPKDERLAAMAALLQIEPGVWRYGGDEAFLAALESPDPTAPDPEPPEDRVASEHRGALVRSLPIETFLRADGLVDGSLAIDVIARPSGKSGAVLKKRHAQRSDRKAQTPVVEIEGVPVGCELVRAEATFELRDEEPAQVIPRGFLLVVDRARKPEPGQLVLAVRNLDARVTEEMSEVRLFRYHKVGPGWGLAAVDGTGRTYGSGDGWEVVAAVLWWRSPP